MVMTVFFALVIFFGLQRWWKSTHPDVRAKKRKTDGTQLISLFRFVGMSTYGLQTSTLLVDALGLALVNSIGDAMEISIQGEGGAFKLSHTLIFSASILALGYGIMHLTELVHVFRNQNKAESLWQQMQDFLFVLSGRACTYLGGFVIQLSVAEWIIETHAEIMLGDKRALEAISHANFSLSADNPSFPEMVPLDAISSPTPGHSSHAAHSLILLKQRLLNATAHHAEHAAAGGGLNKVFNATKKLSQDTAAWFNDEHVRFQATLIVAFAGFALLLTLVGVGLSILTQRFSEKYQGKVAEWKKHHLTRSKPDEKSKGHT